MLLQDADVVVELVDPAGLSVPLDALVPGAYQLVGTFSDGEPRVVGEVQLDYGDVVSIRCSSTVHVCRTRFR